VKKNIETILWPERFMKYIIYGMVAIIPLFVSSSHLFPFTTPKTLLIILGTGVLAILYLIQIYIEKDQVFRVGFIHLFLALYLASMIISGVFGMNPTLSFFGNLTLGIGINLIIVLTIFAVIVGHIVGRDAKFLYNLITISFLSSLLVTTGAYFSSAFPSANGGSTLGNSSYTGAYLFMNLCFAIIIFFKSHITWKKVLVASGVLFTLLSPIFTNISIWVGKVNIFKDPIHIMGLANGAVLALIIGTVTMVILFLMRAERSAYRHVGTALFFAFLAAILIFGMMFNNPNSRLHHAYTELKHNNRFLFWNIASQGFLKSPLIGEGTNSYSSLFQNHFDPQFFSTGYNYEPWTDNPHNMFWEYAQSGGVFGLATYLLVFFGTFLILFKVSNTEDKDKKLLAIVLAGALMGYFAQALFIFDTPAPLLMLFVVIGGSLSLTTSTEFKFPSKGKNLIKISTILGIVAMCILVFMVAIRPWQESRAWVKYTSLNQIAEAKSNPQKISRIGNLEDSAYIAGTVLDYVSSNLSTMNEENKKKNILIIGNLINNLEDEEKEELPNFRAEWVTGQIGSLLVYLSGKPDSTLIEKARIHLNNAININPNNPLVYFDQAQTYIFEKKFTEAFALIRSGIILAPQNKYGYSFAESILKNVPDPKFGKFIKNMETKWGVTI
jgi:hypothetical protein